MSILEHASNTLVQGHLYAVAGDQHIHYDGQAPGGQMATTQGFDMLYRHYSTDALFDAIAHSDQPKCLKGTRVAIIKDILAQVQGKERSGAICWLKGPAGAGKSALEYTIAAICKKKGLLIGGFAFSRTAANRGDGNTLIPTLAIQLSRVIPETHEIIDRTLKANPDIFERSREAQLQLLIVDPLRHLWATARIRDSFRRGWRYPTVIAIDGLDECSDFDIQRDIITSIGAVVRDLDFPLRFFIASRPEAHISQTFHLLQSDKQIRISHMYLGEDAAATRDIQTYLETKFKEVREQHPHLPETWPSSHVIAQLVEKASGQFIYVSTVMAYIASTGARPDASLQVILRLAAPPVGGNPFAQLDLLYSHILSSVKDQAATLEILGCLILPKAYYSHPVADRNGTVIREFKSPTILEALFALERGDVRQLMRGLLSVVAIENDNQPMKVLHASLGDFLLDESRSREHFIDPKKLCRILARRCIKYIAGLKSSSFDVNDVERFIIPSVPLCMKAGLSNELNIVLGNVDILSTCPLLVYPSPVLYPTIREPLWQLQNILNGKADVWDYSIWSTYTYKFQQTRDKNSTSPKDIFVVLTCQWHAIKNIVGALSGGKIALPDTPIGGQVRCTSPRAGDPAIVLVLVPTRPTVPDFVARWLDKRLVESEYDINSNICTVYWYMVQNEWYRQEPTWYFLWSKAQIIH